MIFEDLEKHFSNFSFSIFPHCPFSPLSPLSPLFLLFPLLCLFFSFFLFFLFLCFSLSPFLSISLFFCHVLSFSCVLVAFLCFVFLSLLSFLPLTGTSPLQTLKLQINSVGEHFRMAHNGSDTRPCLQTTRTHPQPYRAEGSRDGSWMSCSRQPERYQKTTRI